MAGETEAGSVVLPSMDEPLPEYARAWGPGLSRLTEFPEGGYDDRIDKSNIFVFEKDPKTGESGPFYVVAEGCHNCKRLLQRCNRGKPGCDRCINSNRECVSVGPGWVRLPLKKITKTSRLKRRSERGSQGMSIRATTVTAVSKSRVTGESNARPHRAAAPKPGTLVEWPILEAEKPNHALAHFEAASVDPLENLRSPAVSGLDTPASLSSVSTGPKIKATRTKAKEKNDITSVASRKRGRPVISKNAALIGLSARKKANKSRKSAAEGNPCPGSLLKVAWIEIRPPVLIPAASNAIETRPRPAGDPRIWTVNKEELLEVMPNLRGGMFYRDGEPPMLFVEGAAWPEDSWKDQQVVLSFVRECTIRTLTTQQAVPNVNRSNDLDADATLAYPEDSDETMIAEPEETMKIIDEAAALEPGLPNWSVQFGGETLTYPLDVSSSVVVVANEIQGSFSPASSTRPFPQLSSHAGTTNEIRHNEPHDPYILAKPSGDLQFPPRSYATFPASTGLTGAFGPQRLEHSLGELRYPPSSDIEIDEAEGEGEGEGGMLQYWDRNRVEWDRSYRSKPSFDHPREFAPQPPPSTTVVQWSSIPPDVEEPLSYPMRISPPSTTNASTWKRMIPLSPQQCRRYHFSYGDGTDETSLISSAEETLVYPEEPPSEIGDVSVWQTLPIPIDPHSLHTLAEKPPDAVQIENTPTSSTAPPEPPEDIQALLDAKTSQIPVSLIISREAKLLPFNLSEKHGCVFLGFFDIKDTSSEVSETSKSDGGTTFRVRWTFRFEWIRGGELDYTLPQPSNPWWMPQTPTSEDDTAIMHPFTILPSQFTLTPVRNSVDDSLVAVSEPVTRKGWHCGGCGRLNVQRHFCFERCPTCAAWNGMSPVGAIYVRNPYNTAPITFPWDRYPSSSVTCTSVKNEESGMRTFIYEISPSVVVKHFFTCNQRALQEDATLLFREFQLTVKLEWQGAKTNLALGPYFTYLAGNGHEGNHSSEAWKGAAPSIARSRKIMEGLMQGDGKRLSKSCTLENLTVLAWYATGHRKSPTPLPAKGRAIALMCLGADVDLTLVPVSGFPAVPEVIPFPETGSDVLAAAESLPNLEYPDEDELVDHMDVDDEPDIPLAGLLREVHKAELEQAAPVPALPVEKVSKEKQKGSSKRGKGEEIFVSMVHGDVLVLSGDDFEWSMRRTGMSIVLIGMTAPTQN
ncbi:unnamed protein product [Somion occarium]|uniref:Zn(2)-C6 fungal-type domain-containing protein n=1 Tax=Somion occarium TaxID=3059160 RepID=A0ABP1E3C1_9APHY